jgi:hypothetical protein
MRRTALEGDDMSSRYYVTAEVDGQDTPGILFDPRLLSETPEPGTAIVADLILPMSYEVDGSTVSDLTWYEAHRAVDEARDEAAAYSRRLGPGIAVGKLFALPHDDGTSWYVVTKLTPTKARVEWRGFGENRRRDARLGWGGRFDRMIIQGHVARHDAMQEIADLTFDAACA